MNKEIMKALGFGKEVTLVEEGKCPFCKTVVRVEDFRDDIRKREFRISGQCQECQDRIFGKGD